ncbi:MAG TPA: hypothetical protein VGC96_13245 [Candidatus Elarobacter sp.]|jgi:hypothetical protein
MTAFRPIALAAAFGAALLGPLAALAQTPAPGSPAPASSAAARPPACTSAHDREFDFWLGDWAVTDRASGKPEGTNQITRELRGCVLQEHWAGAQGGHGTSFNHYDAARKLWHQTWVDDSGGILYLDGGLRNGAMILSGRRPGRNGATVLDRITWTRRPDGSVRQFWESSRDGGKTWSTAFDGIYRRAA